MSERFLVDAGNTRVKWCRAVQTASIGWTLTRHGDGPMGDAETRERLLAVAGSAEKVWLAASAPPRPLASALEQAGYPVQVIGCGDVDVPVMPGYATLGVDRWLAMNGAWKRLGRALCVADVGSAVTVDVVDHDCGHRGGWIAPGPLTAAEALARRAPGLPAFEPSRADSEPALDSPASVASGVMLQQAGFIERCWRQACAVLDDPLPLILTGGGADAVHGFLDLAATRADDLVFEGLLVVTEEADG